MRSCLIQTARMEIFKGLRDTKVNILNRFCWYVIPESALFSSTDSITFITGEAVSVFLKNIFWTTLLPLFLLFSISYYDENHHLSANTFVNVSVYIFQTLSILKVQLIHMIYILYYHMHTENRYKERETSWLTWILTGVLHKKHYIYVNQ